MMDTTTRTHYANLYAQDGDVRYAAMNYILNATEPRVDWSYAVWDDLLAHLQDKNNHVRTIAAQVLANLAKSDPDFRMLHDFDKLLAVTMDEKFVTARHTLQALWKVGTAGTKQQQLVVEGLANRFNDCITEKNCTLIRYDIIQGLKQLYDEVQEESIRARALALIATEQDEKYRKKYASVWKRR
jgi:HEAT repeat protein